MRAAWRVASVRAAEEALMATLPPGTLMRRAATGVARRCGELLADRYGSGYGHSVLLLVGPGNNGGDALFAGAALARRGVTVTAALLNPARTHAEGLAALKSAGGRVSDATPSTVDVVVDGILGIGGRGGLREDAAALVARAVRACGADGARPAVVAVDLPSGVDPDTGAVPGEAVRADVTVTFGVLKPGLLVGDGAVHSGLVELVDIGLGPWLRDDPALRVPDLDDVAEWWPQPGPGDDKYTRGVVGVATGSAIYPGAALLSTGGALAGPAGMVRYAGAAVDAVRFHYPTVIPTPRVADAGRVQAWTCGCGLGTDERAAGELRAVLAAEVPVCVDADGLTLLATDLSVDELRERRAPTVLTPHDREFARLNEGEEPGADRVGSALRLAARTGAVVLLKGDRTIVATPDGRAYVNPTGTPALATAGTGDVLAGLLGSLLAGGLPPERAAVAAAYAHGLAGRYAAEAGPVTASDVVGALRPVLGRTGMWRTG
ncbi:NAD(P)H-hydrate dehydratase [Planosporangium mesophilum]|uniref:Bifunctional NAD(P)H-hydrate repair enzyme n=1 Tax=Planosporangium mesophilum TaxID=689768 RepID=A0A8J3X198_9ACTN|nr:NAD(P)H-hydrate dehydratase [Planosporangium mesophilum]NJC84767.1 NAD(P)H-hydrate dehydratase [Planosporangium mesophilum]GII24215.1 bifunctional NAD(P)H-hydrate repair enzyme [Planosporangium mesophilum]